GRSPWRGALIEVARGTSRSTCQKMTSSERTTNAHNRFSATLLAGSYCCLLEAIDIFTQDLVNKVTTGLLNPSPRETVLIGFYYRSLGYCRTAIELKSVVHQQSLTSAERSVVELYVDMELIHRNVVADGVEKAIAFADVQKLKAAHRMDDFFAGNPGLDSNPSKAALTETSSPRPSTHRNSLHGVCW